MSGPRRIEVGGCQHPNFTASVVVNRVLKVQRFVADIQIRCTACKEPFKFIGLGCGLAYDEPQVSVDGTELRAPIAPAGDIGLGIKGPLTYKASKPL